MLSNGRFFAPRARIPVPMHTYGYPKLIAQMHLEFADGTDQTIVSDASWKLTDRGADPGQQRIRRRRVRRPPGNARLVRRRISTMPAGSRPSLVDPPGGQLEAQMIEPIRVIQELKPVQIVEPKPGVWMVDFGQAFYGVVRLRVAGPAGTRVTHADQLQRAARRHAQLPQRPQRAKHRRLSSSRATAVETWHPRFRGNATRWVQVEGFPGTPTADSFTGLVTHTDHEPVGTFECSNELVNRIYQNACWGTRLQNRSVPMEPDRDERMPWSGHPGQDLGKRGLGVQRGPLLRPLPAQLSRPSGRKTAACKRSCLPTGPSTARTSSGRAS